MRDDITGGISLRRIMRAPMPPLPSTDPGWSRLALFAAFARRAGQSLRPWLAARPRDQRQRAHLGHAPLAHRETNAHRLCQCILRCRHVLFLHHERRTAQALDNLLCDIGWNVHCASTKPTEIRPAYIMAPPALPPAPRRATGWSFYRATLICASNASTRAANSLQLFMRANTSGPLSSTRRSVTD